MEYSPHELLAGWDSYYVILGSSAAALTGLQFVVMALVADHPGPSSPEAVAAFGTPTIVHFCQVLFVAGVLTAPWTSLGAVAIPLVLAGVVGVCYALLTFLRARRQASYQPVLEDWIWHVILPFLAYGSWVVAAMLLTGHGIGAMFFIAAAALLLVYVGIHNSWDTVEYLALQRSAARPQKSE